MKKLNILIVYLFLIACNDTSNTMQTVPYVDINRFMGDWYVIANIPTFIEKNATNAIESYALNKEGNIETTFTFYKNKRLRFGSPHATYRVQRLSKPAPIHTRPVQPPQ